jgi:diaminopimelate epimerase
MIIPFSKYSGSGNDFILIDNRKGVFPFHHKSLITNVCRRRTGIGADGIILLEETQNADFRFRIFNADGSEAEMCGNGIRCFLKFIVELGHPQKEYHIETMHGILPVDFIGDNISVGMGDPTHIQWDKKIRTHDKHWNMHMINTGVPHAVFFLDENEENNLEHIPVDKWGSEIRYHPFFQPHGTNVNFAHLDESGKVRVRTFERGVEGETLACGTGATACALAAAKKYKLVSPISVLPRSNEALEIAFSGEDNFTNITMSGPATHIFNGFFSIQKFF